MRTKRTQGLPVGFVILHHHTAVGSHYDWLIEHPADRSGPLITFRLPWPPSRWTPHATLHAVRLPDHRRIYLTYQGPISDQRGRVQRVDRGIAILHHHSLSHVDITLPRGRRIRLRRVSPDHWLGSMTEARDQP